MIILHRTFVFRCYITIFYEMLMFSRCFSRLTSRQPKCHHLITTRWHQIHSAILCYQGLQRSHVSIRASLHSIRSRALFLTSWLTGGRPPPTWEDRLHPRSSASSSASEGKYETLRLCEARAANRSAAHLEESVCGPSWQCCGRQQSRGARCRIQNGWRIFKKSSGQGMNK